MSQHDTLTQALQDAASSLETISRLAGKAAHPNGDETCMGTFPEVRGYATSRAEVARAALSATQPAQAKQSEPAEHWHRLYLEKCQQYNDRVAQLGGVIEGLEAQAAQGVGDKVFLVATGEIYEGQETYERYEGSPPPLCDYEVLYTVPQPAVAQGASEVFTALADHCPVDNGWFNGRAAQGEPVRHIGDSKFESWYQAHPKANGGDKQLARDAYAAGMFDPVAQGAGEVAAWQASDGGSSYISNEARSRNSAFRELYTIPLYTQPASGADVPPAQPAPVVPDGWKLVPIKCTEAMKDVGGQFEFATISDGRLLAQSMWNELLCATPTPPAQAAADARDAERYRWLRDQANTSVNIDIGAGCEISDTLDAAIDAVLATHQQRQGGGA